MKSGDARVRAIGGVFFRSPDPAQTRDWYRRHLGLRTDAHGTNFSWRRAGEPALPGYTLWSPFARDTSYFGDQEQQFMINYRVDDLDGLLAHLNAAGVETLRAAHRKPTGRDVYAAQSPRARRTYSRPRGQPPERKAAKRGDRGT